MVLKINVSKLISNLYENHCGLMPTVVLRTTYMKNQTDAVRWIDTSVMLGDPLAKAGGKGFSNRLVETYGSGYFDLKPTTESQMRKMKASKSRRKQAEEETLDIST